MAYYNVLATPLEKTVKTRHCLGSTKKTPMPNHCLEVICLNCQTTWCTRCKRKYGKQKTPPNPERIDQGENNPERCPDCGSEKVAIL
jgi:DNA-directed RNA polymerase subunit RPC12/RpoP